MSGSGVRPTAGQVDPRLSRSSVESPQQGEPGDAQDYDGRNTALKVRLIVVRPPVISCRSFRVVTVVFGPCPL